MDWRLMRPLETKLWPFDVNELWWPSHAYVSTIREGKEDTWAAPRRRVVAVRGSKTLLPDSDTRLKPSKGVMGSQMCREPREAVMVYKGILHQMGSGESIESDRVIVVHRPGYSRIRKQRVRYDGWMRRSFIRIGDTEIRNVLLRPNWDEYL